VSARGKCRKCGHAVVWYRRKSDGSLITIGGKAYGDCGCDLTTWVQIGGQAKQVSHAAVTL
jgi:hypothetical protein